MKKLVLLSILILIINFIALPQSVKEDYTDEFTGKHIMRTSWIDMTFSFTSTGYFRVSKIDSTFYVDFRLIGDLQYSTMINEGPVFFFKLSDNSIVKLYNTESKIVSRGGGAVGLVGSNANGVLLHLFIRPNQIDSIISTPVVKFRLQTASGYYDKDFSEDRYIKFKKLIELFYKK